MKKSTSVFIQKKYKTTTWYVSEPIFLSFSSHRGHHPHPVHFWFSGVSLLCDKVQLHRATGRAQGDQDLIELVVFRKNVHK